MVKPRVCTVIPFVSVLFPISYYVLIIKPAQVVFSRSLLIDSTGILKHKDDWLQLIAKNLECFLLDYKFPTHVPDPSYP